MKSVLIVYDNGLLWRNPVGHRIALDAETFFKCGSIEQIQSTVLSVSGLKFVDCDPSALTQYLLWYSPDRYHGMTILRTKVFE